MRLACILIAAGLSLAGCASQTPLGTSPTAASTTGTAVVQTGQITDVRDVAVASGQTSGIGSILGSVAGAILGSKIGSGYGSTAASVGGSIAGGIAGNAAERSRNDRRSTEVTVRLENGEFRNYAVEAGETFRIGDPVKVTTTNGISRVTH